MEGIRISTTFIAAEQAGQVGMLVSLSGEHGLDARNIAVEVRPTDARVVEVTFLQAEAAERESDGPWVARAGDAEAGVARSFGVVLHIAGPFPDGVGALGVLTIEADVTTGACRERRRLTLPLGIRPPAAVEPR